MITERQQLNTKTPSFSIQYRYFSGPVFSSVLEDGVTALFNSWTAPDTGRPGGWTEITSRVSFRGSFASKKQGSSVTWTADLQGYDYSEALLGLSVTIVAWRQVYRPTGTVGAPAGWQSWELDFIGQIIERGETLDYRNGEEWTRKVGGIDTFLAGYNGPRLTTGIIRVTEGATVNGSTPLAQPELERDRGEFVGGSTTVSADNVVDGKPNTVYISDTVPASSANSWPGTHWDGWTVVSEVFFKPIPGWPLERSWWVEIFNAREQDDTSGFGLTSGRFLGGDPSNDGNYVYDNVSGWPDRLERGHFAVVCANREIFDKLCGGARVGAKFVVDASQYNPNFNLHPTDGGVATGEGGGVAWSPGGAERRYSFWHSGYAAWNPTAGVDSDLVLTGYSIVWNGGWPGVNNSMRADKFVIEPSPHPGNPGATNDSAWLKVTLPDNVCQLTAPVTGASTVIPLNNYRGWIAPYEGETRQGVVQGNVFNWTSRDATGLKGVTWVNVPGAEIPVGTRVYPYENGIAQTGLPLTSTSIVRRKSPVIENYRAWWAYAEARDYNDVGWASDYYTHFHTVTRNSDLKITDELGIDQSPYLWVRTITYVIDRMLSPRARLTAEAYDASVLEVDDTTGWPATGTVSVFQPGAPRIVKSYSSKDLHHLYLTSQMMWIYAVGSEVINEDFSRAKVNEITADLYQRALDWEGQPDLDGSRSADLAKYILTAWVGLKAEDFVDQSKLSTHIIGQHALAITPITTVLDDLARVTGCIVWYGRNGKIYWRSDHWWPNAEWDPGEFTFDGDSVRGQASHSNTRSEVSHVILNALSVDGDPHPVRVVYPIPGGNGEPPPWAITKEINELVITRDADGVKLAQMKLEELLLGTRAIRLVTVGPGEWCMPSLKVYTYLDLDGDGSPETVPWLIEEVNTSRDMDESAKSYTTELTLRSFRA